MLNKATVTNSKGFSLIEALIALAIIAITAMIATPFFGGFVDNRNLKNAASDIAAAINQSKEKAAAEDRVYRVSFPGNYYRVRQCQLVGPTCTTSTSGYNLLSEIQLSSYGNGIQVQSADTPIYISPRGLLTSDTNNFPTPAITLTNSRGSTAIITVTLTGRTSVALAMQ